MLEQDRVLPSSSSLGNFVSIEWSMIVLYQGCQKQFRSGTAMGVVIRSHTLILTLIIWSCNKYSFLVIHMCLVCGYQAIYTWSHTYISQD